MDWAALPPEINSARMYAGPGATSLIQAAGAWATLAAELNTTSEGFGQVVNGLAATWRGTSFQSMHRAASMYQAWLTTTALLAQKTATQAMSAVAAYESAFAATVPPAVIAANRSLLASLVATNFLGINTPAIMATEAQYMEMWVQDAVAMFGYQAGSVQATQLTPFTPLNALTTGVLPSVVSSIQGNVQSVLSGFQGSLLDETWQSLLSSGFWFSAPEGVLQSITGTVALYSLAQGQRQIEISEMQLPSPPPEPVPAVAGGASSLTLPGLSAAATFGQSPKVGQLAVPKSWGQATGNDESLVTPLGTDEFTGIPGVPILGSIPKKDSESARYGFRPKRVIPRHPSAG